MPRKGFKKRCITKPKVLKVENYLKFGTLENLEALEQLPEGASRRKAAEALQDLFDNPRVNWENELEGARKLVCDIVTGNLEIAWKNIKDLNQVLLDNPGVYVNISFTKPEDYKY